MLMPRLPRPPFTILHLFLRYLNEYLQKNLTERGHPFLGYIVKIVDVPVVLQCRVPTILTVLKALEVPRF